MSLRVRRHDNMPQIAFLHSTPCLHPHNLTSGVRIQRGNTTYRQQVGVRRRIVRIIPSCNTGKPHNSQPHNSQGSGSTDNSNSEEPKRTLAGRIAVEVLSLIVGAILLLTVVLWRACQVVSLNVWRALVWLSNVRQLGKWAVRRIANADSIILPITSFRELVSRVYGSTLSGIQKIGQEAISRSTVQTVPVQEEAAEVAARETDAAVGETEQPEHVYEQPVTDIDAATGRRLILLRHAKTTWNRDSEIPDHDRVLSAQGKEEARLVGYELANSSWLPDVVLCSDAVRTVQTLSLLDIPDHNPASTTCTEALYFAVTGDEMASAVDDTLGSKGFADDTTLMVVCHNPGCEELVEQLTGERLDMGTGCAALLEYSHDIETEGEEESEFFRLSPQRMRWSLARVIRPASLSSSSR